MRRVIVDEEVPGISELIEDIKKNKNECGAICCFIGVVRGLSENERVMKLEFDSYRELAESKLDEIIEELMEKYGILDIRVAHKIGELYPGEDIIYIVVASRHREECFKSVREMIDRLKEEAPIWKKEYTESKEYWVD
ncbi:MAG: molybdenum cofactor biosynthesis protein MoaE [Candidatus Hydrothermarchaeota archaeon]